MTRVKPEFVVRTIFPNPMKKSFYLSYRMPSHRYFMQQIKKHEEVALRNRCYQLILEAVERDIFSLLRSVKIHGDEITTQQQLDAAMERYSILFQKRSAASILSEGVERLLVDEASKASVDEEKKVLDNSTVNK